MRLALPSIALARDVRGLGGPSSASCLGMAARQLAVVGEPAQPEPWVMDQRSAGCDHLRPASAPRLLPLSCTSADLMCRSTSRSAASAGSSPRLGSAAASLAPDWTSNNWVDVLMALLGLGSSSPCAWMPAIRDARTRRSDARSGCTCWPRRWSFTPVIRSRHRRHLAGIDTTQAILILGPVHPASGSWRWSSTGARSLVSGLTYAGIAIAYLLSQRVEAGLGVSLTLLGLAVVVLGLSAGWRSLRRAVLPLLPLGQLRQHIPPADLAFVPMTALTETAPLSIAGKQV